MIDRAGIEKTLRQIDRLYGGSSSAQEGLLYSKLAILELCGWIESSMDNIVLSLAKQLIRNPDHLIYFEKEVVGKVYGFEYEKHFRRMVIALIGLHGVETMEKNVNPRVFAPMCASLNALKPNRDKLAHTYIKGATTHLDGPSVILGRLHTVHAGLVDIEQVLKAIK